MTTRVQTAGFAALVLLGLILRLGFLTRADLYGDEATSWAAASGSWSGLPERIAALEVKPPLYSVALHLWMRVFGDGVASLRAESVVWWPPFALFLGLLALRTCGRWAFLPLLLAALSPLLIYYGVEVRHYSLLLCAETLFLWLAVRAEQERTRNSRRWLAAGSLATMGAQFTGAFFILPVLIALCMPARKSRKDLAELLLPQVAAGAIFLLHLAILAPGLWSSLGGTETNWWARPPSAVQVLSAPVRLLAPVISWKPFLSWNGPSGPLLLLGAAVLTALAAWGVATHPQRRILGAATAGVLALVALYSVLRANLLFERYYIGCAPALLVGIGCAVDELSRRNPASARPLAAAALISQIVVLFQIVPFKDATPYRPAVDAVLAQERGRLVLLTGNWDLHPVHYYSRHEEARVLRRSWPVRVDELRADGVPVYVIESRAWGDRTGSLRRALSKSGTLVPVHDAGGTAAWRWVPSP